MAGRKDPIHVRVVVAGFFMFCDILVYPNDRLEDVKAAIRAKLGRHAPFAFSIHRAPEGPDGLRWLIDVNTSAAALAGGDPTTVARFAIPATRVPTAAPMYARISQHARNMVQLLVVPQHVRTGPPKVLLATTSTRSATGYGTTTQHYARNESGVHAGSTPTEPVAFEPAFLVVAIFFIVMVCGTVIAYMHDWADRVVILYVAILFAMLSIAAVGFHVKRPVYRGLATAAIPLTVLPLLLLLLLLYTNEHVDKSRATTYTPQSTQTGGDTTGSADAAELVILSP